MEAQDTKEGKQKYSVANFYYEKVIVGNPVKLRFTKFLKLESFHENHDNNYFNLGHNLPSNFEHWY